MPVTSKTAPNPLADGPAIALTRSLTVLLAVSVGVIVTNLFAAQTLVGLIGSGLGLGPRACGLVATASLLGYAAGLFFLVPLADLLENRQLVVRMLGCAAICAAAAAMAPNAWLLLLVLFLLGTVCAAIQILVPIAASMASPEQRGRVIGDVMSGLMVGILVSRPLASLAAAFYGWRAYYGLSALTLALLTGVLAHRLPVRRPTLHTGYAALIGSLWHLLRTQPVLRRRSLTATLCMAAFSLFWTAVALRLAEPPFALGQRGIALFALAGVAGAVTTPLAGRAGDRGWTGRATLASHLAMAAAFGLAAWAGTAGAATPLLGLVGLGAGAILLDAGATGDQTLGRREVNLLAQEARSRLNGLFVGLFFLGGAAGSACAGLAWGLGGWTAVCSLGAAISGVALLVDFRRRSRVPCIGRQRAARFCLTILPASDAAGTGPERLAPAPATAYGLRQDPWKPRQVPTMCQARRRQTMTISASSSSLPTRPFGRTDMKITRVGFGAWAIGGGDWAFGWGSQEDRESVAAIRHAVERGINWIDTAAVYGLGRSEQIVGEALSGIPADRRPYLFTKCGLVWDEADRNATPKRIGRPDSIKRECEASLKRLGVERIDLYQVHWPAEDGTPIEAYWQAMLDLKREGKVRAVGLSNHSVAQLEAAEKLGHVDTLQPPFSAIRRDVAAAELPWCHAHRTGVIVYSPMQSGLLSGSFTRQRAAELPGNDWRSRNPHYSGENLERNLALADALKPVAERRKTSVAAVAVAWALAWPGVSGAIVGARRPAQVDGWFDAASLELNAADLQEIAQAIERTGAGSGPRLPPT